MAASGLLVPSQSRNLLANEFRVIKRPLIANAMGKGSTPIPNGNLIMVTSALPGADQGMVSEDVSAMTFPRTLKQILIGVVWGVLGYLLSMPILPGR